MRQARVCCSTKAASIYPTMRRSQMLRATVSSHRNALEGQNFLSCRPKPAALVFILDNPEAPIPESVSKPRRKERRRKPSHRIEDHKPSFARLNPDDLLTSGNAHCVAAELRALSHTASPTVLMLDVHRDHQREPQLVISDNGCSKRCDLKVRGT
jgi:hypothetical protein